MPNVEGSSSLFDLARKQQQKKAEIAPKISSTLGPKGEQPSAILSADEIAATFLRCKEMHDELKKRVETTYEEAKVSPRKVQEYISNPTHFSAKDWESLQKTKKQFDEKLKQFRPESMELDQNETGSQDQDKEKKKIKSSFMSRKRWLSMH